MRTSLSFAHAVDASTAEAIMATALPQVPYDFIADGASQAIVADLDADQVGTLRYYVSAANEQRGGEFQIVTAQPS